MTEGVVDAFETVQVDKQDCYRIWNFTNVRKSPFKLVLKQEAITETGERIVVSKIKRSCIGLFANRHFAFQLLVKAHEKRGTIDNVLFKIIVRLRQRFGGCNRLQLSPPPSYLGVRARQRDSKIHRLGDVVVCTEPKRLDDILALGLCGDHYYRKN